jgi:hypothetical protein
MGSVAHVQTNHVCAFGNECLDNFRTVSRGAEGAKDLGFTHGVNGWEVAPSFQAAIQPRPTEKGGGKDRSKDPPSNQPASAFNLETGMEDR